jgi:hypothetical protein
MTSRRAVADGLSVCSADVGIELPIGSPGTGAQRDNARITVTDSSRCQANIRASRRQNAVGAAAKEVVSNSQLH